MALSEIGERNHAVRKLRCPDRKTEPATQSTVLVINLLQIACSPYGRTPDAGIAIARDTAAIPRAIKIDAGCCLMRAATRIVTSPPGCGYFGITAVTATVLPFGASGTGRPAKMPI